MNDKIEIGIALWTVPLLFYVIALLIGFVVGLDQASDDEKCGIRNRWGYVIFSQRVTCEFHRWMLTPDEPKDHK